MYRILLILAAVLILQPLMALNFTEDWESSSFATNGWTFEDTIGHWEIWPYLGNPGTSARFAGMPPAVDYSFTLVSPEQDASLSTEILIGFDLNARLLTPQGTEELCLVARINGENWQEIDTFNDNTPGDDFDWQELSYNCSALLAGNVFQLGFRAQGADSFGLIRWNIDNISILDENGLGEPGSVSGLITDSETGLPVAGALIIAASSSTTSDGSGYYSLELYAGTYELQCQHPDYVPGSEVIELAEGEVLTQDFSLLPLASVQPPQDLQAVVDSNNVTLTWTAPDTGSLNTRELLGYNIYRNGWQLNFTPLTEYLYQDSGLTNGEYQYQVTALYDGIESEPSNSVFVEILTCQTPEIYNVTVNLFDFDGNYLPHAHLGWSIMTGALGYNIYRNSELLNEELWFSNQYSDTTMTNLHTYEYYVTAVYPQGESQPSETVSVDFYLPPYNLYGVPYEDHVYLSWEAPEITFPDVQIIGYNLYLDNWILVNDEPLTDTNYPDFEIIPGEFYNYSVTALYSIGESMFSYIISVRPGEDVILPPQSVMATAGPGEVNLSWLRPEDSGEWFSWQYENCGEAFGAPGNDTFTAAVYFDEWDLMTHHGKLTSQVAFQPGDPAADYTMLVYMRDYFNPDELMLVQEIPLAEVTAGDWNTVEIASQYIEGGNTRLKIGIRCENYSEAPLYLDQGPNTSGKSDQINLDGQWSNLTQEFGLDANWKIKLLVKEMDDDGGEMLNNRQGNISLAAFNLYRNNEQIASLNHAWETYHDAGLEPGTYEYTLSAVYNVMGIVEMESPVCEPVEVIVEEQLLAPANLQVEIQTQGALLSWSAPGSENLEELFYDNDNWLAGLGCSGMTFAMRLSPAQTCQIMTLKFYTSYTNPVSHDFQAKIYDWDGNQPSLMPLFSTTYPAVEMGWQEYDVSAENLTMTGDFVLGFGSIMEDTFLGYNYYPSHRAWNYDVLTGSWENWEGTYFIRALVQYQDGSVATLEPAIYPQQVNDEENYSSRELLGYRIYLNDQFAGETSSQEYYLDGLINGSVYLAGVTAVYDGGESEPVTVEFIFTGTGSEDNAIVDITELKGNFPNPFNPVTKISFALAQAAETNLTIYNNRGQKVRTLVAEHLDAGYHCISWDGTDDQQRAVGSGIYFCRLQSGEYQSHRKMTLMK